MKNKQLLLSEKELEELKGGAHINNERVIDFASQDKDILNNNQVSNCRCTYSNFSQIENRNGIQGCSCLCGE